MEQRFDITNPASHGKSPDSTIEKYYKFFKWRIRRKFLLFILLPLIALGLIVYGLFAQGIAADWYNAFRKASLTVTIQDKEGQALAGAQIILGEVTGTTDKDGFARLDGLVAGKRQITIRRDGFIAYTSEIKLKKGENALGTIQLEAAPVAKVDLTLEVLDYISEQAINDATVTLDTITPIYEKDIYTFNSVPIGKHTLSVSKNDYISYSTEVVVEKDTRELPAISLTPVGRVVFESNRDRGLRGIFSANYDGSDQKSIIARVGDYEDYFPRLGPNQRKLFFSGTRDGEKDSSGTSYRSYVYLVDVDGSNLKKIVRGESGSGRWSPDGRYIGLTDNNYPDKQFRFYIYDVITGKLTTVAQRNSDYNSYYSFLFSEDSTKAAYSGFPNDDPSSKRAIYIGTIGQDFKMIEGTDNSSATLIAFSKTGKLRYSLYANNRTNYYEYDPSTNSSQAYQPEIRSYGSRYNATTSPDGKWIAYISYRDGKNNVYISDASDKNERQLTVAGGAAGNIIWGKNSQFLTYEYEAVNEAAIDVVSISGKAYPKKVVDISGVYRYDNQ